MSEPGVTPAIHATMTHGGDWIHGDPDGKRLRLDVRSVLQYAPPPARAPRPR